MVTCFTSLPNCNAIDRHYGNDEMGRIDIIIWAWMSQNNFIYFTSISIQFQFIYFLSYRIH